DGNGMSLEYNSATDTWEESLAAGGTPGAQNSVDRTIVDAAVADADFSTLVTAVIEAGLVEALSGTGPFTVFAPDNDAFAALPDGVVANLLENTDVLTEILTYHVVSGEFNATQVLAADNLTTLQGENLEINASAVTIDGATIDMPDYAFCANGIIHRIDAVMLPQSVQSSVMLDYPTGGETLGGMVPIQWSTTTPEDITLDITLAYKNTTAAEWTTIAEDEDNDGLYRWDVTEMNTDEQYMIQITATDSLGIPWTATSDAFSLTDMTVTPKTATYNETKTIDVTGTTGTTNLYYPIHSVFPAGYGLKLSRDGSGGSARFSSVQFNTTGSWVVEDEGTGALFYMYVEPIELNVTASPTEVDYTKTTEGWVTVNGTVTRDGTAMSGVTVEIWEPGHIPGVGTPFATATTNTDGEFTMTDVGILNKGAGTYNITARIGPFDNADAFGYTTMTVNPIDANVTLYDMEDVSGGFSTGEIVFQVLFPDGTQLLPGNDYNVSVWMGDELYAWMNTSDATEGGNMTFTEYGKFLNITPVDIWEQNTYTLKVEVNYAGDINWEYTGEADFTIPEP
ncbi:MAG: fasciclin domain-containing protein, partial [Thermoplasmatota archaeon]